jgi:RNA polymerase sigma-70 factor, ECF subfamily
MDFSQLDVTVLLSELSRGNKDAVEKLTPLIYDELKRLARSYMRRERPDHTLQATGLVHEAYLKLVQQENIAWESRSHFFGIAAHLMRQILIDHARAHLCQKRGGALNFVPLNEALAFSPEKSEELVRLDEALKHLSAIDARQGKVVELRFFGGLSVEETAEYLKVSPKTVKRDWALAKRWLLMEMRRGDGDLPATVATR